ncbi:MAG: hypothetical protein WKG07_01995 [Hymenobacter sp.]
MRHRVPAASYPFDARDAGADQLTAYQEHRDTLRNLFIDETQQLHALVQALRSKITRQPINDNCFCCC